MGGVSDIYILRLDENIERENVEAIRRVVLEITTLHNGMILSTLSISSHGFVLGFPKRSHTNGDSIPHL